MVELKSLDCTNCGGSLKIPQNFKGGSITCESCEREFFVEGAVGKEENEEMAKKNNIASGTLLRTSVEDLHRICVKAIVNTAGFPADVFDNAEVTRLEHHAVPAFRFRCKGNASFSYQIGTEQVQYVPQSDGQGRTWTETRTNIQWLPQNSTALANSMVIAPASKEFAHIVLDLYSEEESTKDQTDFEKLNYPDDIITHNFEVPEMDAFLQYAEPIMKEKLEETAIASLEGQHYQNARISGANIEKTDVSRIFLSMYRMIVKYNDKEYWCCVTGDGSRMYYQMPVDPDTGQKIEERKARLESALAAVPVPSTGMWTGIMIGAIALGVLGACVSCGGCIACMDLLGEVSCVLGVVGILIALAVGIGGAIFAYTKKESLAGPYNEECEKIRNQCAADVEILQTGAKDAENRFRKDMRPLKGYFMGKVDGRPDAFEK